MSRGGEAKRQSQRATDHYGAICNAIKQRREAFRLGHAVRTEVATSEDTRALWFQAAGLAMESLTEDADDPNRIEDALVLSQEILRDARRRIA